MEGMERRQKEAAWCEGSLVGTQFMIYLWGKSDGPQKHWDHMSQDISAMRRYCVKNLVYIHS